MIAFLLTRMVTNGVEFGLWLRNLGQGVYLSNKTDNIRLRVGD